MARPKVQRSDLGNVDEMVRPVQQLRYKALVDFRDLLEEPDVQRAVKTDDRLFSTLLSLAFEEYGVRQSDIADAMELSAGVLGRWAKEANLPVSALRPLVIQTIVEAMKGSIDKMSGHDIPRGRLIAV